MAWDEESFKNGFATGRALWNSVAKYSKKEPNVGLLQNQNSNQPEIQNEEENGS